MNIAVTGGIGSGKSMVAGALGEMVHGVVVSADSICRELLAVGNPGWLGMQEEFPADFFLADGNVNRPLLRKAIFSDPILRDRLDAILHPLARQELLRHFIDAQKEKRDLVAEVPLLFEKGWQADFDLTVVVFADEELCVQRIVTRDNVSTEEARLSLASQMPLVEKSKLSDFVIDNSGTVAVTLEQLHDLLEKLPDSSYFKRKRNES
ncbi:MAG: dephospho-CoA kinase [Thermodesulfobacteriota bacterium]